MLQDESNIILIAEDEQVAVGVSYYQTENENKDIITINKEKLIRKRGF